jgi:transposase
MAQIEIFRGQARRRWSVEAKRRLVAETLVPGATVHAVAQRHGVNTSQLFTWRKRFRGEFGRAPIEPPAPAFAVVELAAVPEATETSSRQAIAATDALTSAGVIEIELPQGARVRISGEVAPAVVTAALRALMQR